MIYTLEKDAPFTAKVDAIVIPLTEAAAKKLPPELSVFDQMIGGQLQAALDAGDFKGEEHTTLMLYEGKAVPAFRILLIGAGKPKDITLLEWQHVVGTAARMLQGMKCARWALALPREFRRACKPEDLGRMCAKGIFVATYHFTEYKSEDAEQPPLPAEVVVGPLTVAQQRRFRSGLDEGSMIGTAMNWARRLGDMPSSDATPSYLALQAQKLARNDKRYRVKVIEKAGMEQLGMGALLGVARGSQTPPKCIVVEWRGNARKKEWYAFVGKAITFDSGGISLKPGEKMDEMKFDMCGGAAVLGAMQAIGALKLPVNIVGIVPATDNVPSGSSYKPGDILKTCRGKTIEVLNTDAEGRIVLADGLGYAQRYEPKAIVDLATLTGACVVALGYHYSGLFANTGKLLKEMENAAAWSGERAWHLPLGDAYTREVKSEIADWQNLGKEGRWGGAITAAAFLEQFVEHRPWAHLDIAGTAWLNRPYPWIAKGATGVGVHLLVELAKKWSR